MGENIEEKENNETGIKDKPRIHPIDIENQDNVEDDERAEIINQGTLEREKKITHTGTLEKFKEKEIKDSYAIPIEEVEKLIVERDIEIKKRKTLEKELRKLKNKFNNSLKKAKENLEDKINETKKEFDKKQMNVISVLAIFVSLFTFISVSVSLFKEISSQWMVVGFLLFILGAFGLFLLLIFAFFKIDDLDKIKTRFMILVGVLCLLALVFGYKVINKDMIKISEIKDSFNEKINSTEDKFVEEVNLFSSSTKKIIETKLSAEEFDNFKNCLKNKQYWQYEECFQ